MIEYLKCDAEDCDHIEDVDSVTEDHVGKPCPKCGENLLTQEDYEAWKPFQETIELVEKINRKLDNSDFVTFSVGVRGSKTTIEVDRND